jgi:hypothetical protein
MDASENRIFFLEVALVHFPSLNTYLTNSTSNMLATLDAWAVTLRDISTEEAISVVYRWSRDELPRPSFYELGDFALHLRGVVMRDRADSRQAINLDAMKDRETQPGSYTHVSLKPFMARIWASGDAYRAGTISREQHDENTKQVLTDHDAEYRKANLR